MSTRARRAGAESIARLVALITSSAMLSACSVTFPVVGGYDAYNEVLKGTGTSNMRGSGHFEIEGQVSKVRCTGQAFITYTPGIPFSCTGQRGRAFLTCEDGRRGDGDYYVTSCSSGYGLGRDSEGNRFWFAFGMSEQEAEARVAKELTLAAKRPELPAYRPKETRVDKGYATGTGFFVSVDGYVVTNHHVVDEAKEITVVMPDKSRAGARLVKSDPAHDVALLKIDAQTQPVAIGQARVEKGEEVFTLGYPLVAIQGQEAKATFGRVNALSGVKDDVRFLQVDVPIQPGNSGGPLINGEGLVIGVMTATLDQLQALRQSGALPQNVNYAVKIDYVIPLLQSQFGEDWKMPDVPSSRRIPELVREAERSVVLVIAK